MQKYSQKGRVSGVKEEKLNLLKHSGDIFIFACENSPKITNVKQILYKEEIVLFWIVMSFQRRRK